MANVGKAEVAKKADVKKKKERREFRSGSDFVYVPYLSALLLLILQ